MSQKRGEIRLNTILEFIKRALFQISVEDACQMGSNPLKGRAAILLMSHNAQENLFS